MHHWAAGQGLEVYPSATSGDHSKAVRAVILGNFETALPLSEPA